MEEPGIYYPETLNAEQLDILLARGWYRMGQGIFTTKYIIQEEKVFRVFWLRYDLLKIRQRKIQQKINKVNSAFTTTVLPITITEEMETLYTLYKSEIEFEPAESVRDWLYDQQEKNVYNSWAIEIRDNGMLIAVGIFDISSTSIAGIMNFYHPAYKKYSLGKYLMLQKIAYAQKQQLQWYYPGYIVYAYPKFDYKLFADKAAAEIYLPEIQQWCLYNADLLDELEKNVILEESDQNL